MATHIIQQINTELSELQNELSHFRKTVNYLSDARDVAQTAVQSVEDSKIHLSKTVGELKSTYDAVIGLIDTITEVLHKLNNINFPERLDSIEDNIKMTVGAIEETKLKTISELQVASQTIISADFETKFAQLKELVNISIVSNSKFVETFENQQLGAKIELFKKDIVNSIDKINRDITEKVPQFIDRLTKTINDINLPTRIDNLDTNISDIILSTQNLLSRLDSVDQNISEKLKSIQKLNEERFQQLNTKLAELDQGHILRFQQLDTKLAELDQGHILRFQQLNTKLAELDHAHFVRTMITWGIIILSFILFK